MKKQKIIMLLCLIIAIFSISNIFAKTETNTLKGKIIYLDPGHGR